MLHIFILINQKLPYLIIISFISFIDFIRMNYSKIIVVIIVISSIIISLLKIKTII